LFARIVDLTHTISAGAPTFDDSEILSVRTVASYDTHGCFAREITLPEHFATHVDAPAHFTRDAWTVDTIPVERLVRPLAVLDVSTQVENNPDYTVRLVDIAAWETIHSRIPPAAVVMAHTGWDRRWNSPESYRNMDLNGVRHFPGFSLEAAQFLTDERDAAGLGIDTLSVDAGYATDFPVHHYTASRGVYHLEAVANLDQVPATGATVVVAPAKLLGGSGGPVRLFALIHSI